MLVSNDKIGCVQSTMFNLSENYLNLTASNRFFRRNGTKAYKRLSKQRWRCRWLFDEKDDHMCCVRAANCILCAFECDVSSYAFSFFRYSSLYPNDHHIDPKNKYWNAQKRQMRYSHINENHVKLCMCRLFLYYKKYIIKW